MGEGDIGCGWGSTWWGIEPGIQNKFKYRKEVRWAPLGPLDPLDPSDGVGFVGEGWLGGQWVGG